MNVANRTGADMPRFEQEVKDVVADTGRSRINPDIVAEGVAGKAWGQPNRGDATVGVKSQAG
ncbi:UNVERIFIED_ORG: hypothetical protein ABIC43_003831 [Variovorax guangxiensis]